MAAGAVVLVTFLLALPVYWYVVGRSPDGRGATGLLEDLIPGWRGKLIVLTLLGFAAADFVITRSLSLADAAVHLIHNPHGQRLARPPAGRAARATSAPGGRRSTACSMRLADPQVAVTLGLSIVSFALLHVLQARRCRGACCSSPRPRSSCYLALTAVVIGSAARLPRAARRDLERLARRDVRTHRRRDAGARRTTRWLWAWLSVALWSFPQMALGLSGFEMIMTVVPQVSGGRRRPTTRIAATGRVRNTRKLMLAAASIMAVYLVSAVVVTTLLVPRRRSSPAAPPQHRRSPTWPTARRWPTAPAARALNPLFGDRFGDLYDLSTVAHPLPRRRQRDAWACSNLLPHYLNRLGMEVSWAGKVGVILHVLNVIVLLVTVVFRASPSSQQWAYATSVLVLLAGAALAAADRSSAACPPLGVRRMLRAAHFAAAGAFFLAMTGLTVLHQPLGPHDRRCRSSPRFSSARSSRGGFAAPSCGSRASNSPTKPRGAAGTSSAAPAPRCSRRIARG